MINQMRKYKGVLIFYTIIIISAFIICARFDNLSNNSNSSNNIIAYEN